MDTDNEPETNDTSEGEGATYELSLKGEGITVEREIEEEIALQVLAAVMGRPESAPGARAAGKPSRVGAGHAGRGRSLREYLDEVGAKRNVDKILAIASYLEAERGIETFSSDEIKKQFRSASEPVPGNYSRDFRWAVAAGWVAPDPGEPGEYYVTDKGRNAVADKFSAEVRKATGVGRTARRRRSGKSAGSES